MKAYIDACLSIYLVEERQPYASKIEALVANSAPIIFCISPLVEMKCLILPLRNHDKILTEKFFSWFSSVSQLAIAPEVFRASARLRADFQGLRNPDALHLSTALYHGCDEFWTNDNRVDKVAPKVVRNILDA